jgi:hypothetical protein
MHGSLSVRFDNQGLLKKQTSFRKFALTKYSAALHSEWDAIISVYNLMDRFPQLPVLKHVFGHQDNSLDYDDLPLDAQMNTQADTLATMELDEYSTVLPSVPFDPESTVMISIDGTTVTRHLETTLRTKAQLPALLAYYQDRLKWDQRTFHAIDWEVFGGVYPKMQHRRNFLTKFCYYTLPTGERLHRRESSYDDRCPTCHAPDKSDDHLLQCHSPARRAWRGDLIQTLIKPLDSFPDPLLLDILQEGLLHFFRDEKIDSTPYPLRYQQLLTQQLAIGWNHFVRGKFSEEWRYLQQQYCTRYHCIMDNKQKQWLSQLLRKMWSRDHDLWLAHNDDRHGRTSKAKYQATHQQTLRTIRMLYLLKDLVLSEDRDIFYDDIEAHLLQPTRELKSWGTINQGLIAYSARVAKLAARSRTKPITEHFITLQRRKNRRHSTRAVLPPSVNYRNTKLTAYVSLVDLSRAHTRVQKPTPSVEKRPHLRQSSLHNLWPDPFR